jgi:hypothetical protein
VTATAPPYFSYQDKVLLMRHQVPDLLDMRKGVAPTAHSY